VSAAASGPDGFYGLIQRHIEIDLKEREARRRKRTGRAIWVSDAIFQAARIPGNLRSILRKNMEAADAGRPVAEAWPPANAYRLARSRKLSSIRVLVGPVPVDLKPRTGARWSW